MSIGVILGVLIIFSFIMGGWALLKSGRNWVKALLMGVNLLLLVGLFVWGVSLVVPNIASAAEAGSGGDSANGLGYLAAGLAVGIASIGAGIGVGISGASAIGAMSEKPEILGRTLIIVGLAEGVAIYGLIISIMILSRL